MKWFPAAGHCVDQSADTTGERYLVVLLVSGVVFQEPVGQRSVFKGSSDSMFHLDLPQSVSVRNHLHHT